MIKRDRDEPRAGRNRECTPKLRSPCALAYEAPEEPLGIERCGLRASAVTHRLASAASAACLRECASVQNAWVDERKLARSSLGLQRARPARHYHETFGLTSYSGRGVLRCAKYRRARAARAPRSFRPVRDACAGAHRARSAQRRASWRLQHLEKYDIRRTAPVGVCRDAGRRDRGPTRIGRSMRLTVRQVFGLKGYRTNGAIRLRPRWRGSIAGPAPRSAYGCNQ